MDIQYLADRRATIPKIAAWYFDQWRDRIPENSVEEISRRLEKYLNRDKIPLALVAVDNDSLLGVGQLKYYEMDIYPLKEHWIGGIFVPPEHRGKGIATRLVTRLTDIAHTLEVNTLYLQTEQLNGGLYTRLGWKPVERVVYKGQEVLVMKKQLREG